MRQNQARQQNGLNKEKIEVKENIMLTTIGGEVKIWCKAWEDKGQEEREGVKEGMEKHLFCVRGRLQTDSGSQGKRKRTTVTERDY